MCNSEKSNKDFLGEIHIMPFIEMKHSKSSWSYILKLNQDRRFIQEYVTGRYFRRQK